MNTIKTLSATICTLLMLTACGGGNGGSSLLSAAERPAPIPTTPTPSTQSSSQDTNTSNSTTNTTTNSAANTGASSLYTGITSTKPSSDSQTGSGSTSSNTGKNNNAPPATNTGIVGFVNVITPQLTLSSSTIFGTPSKAENTDDINKIIIGNETFDLKKQADYVTGTKMRQLQYGYFPKQDRQLAFFAQGNPTQTMPTQGVATYKGSAIHGVMGDVDMLIETAAIQLQVNFDKKTIEGKVNSLNPIQLSASISGNSFSGTKDDIQTMGYFYGDNAAEMGGIYANKNSAITGSFGAKK